MIINYNKLISVQQQHTQTDTCTHINTVDHVVTSRAVNMELVSVCMAQGHLTAPNKTLINTRPLKVPAGSVFVCVCVFAMDLRSRLTLMRADMCQFGLQP